MFKSLSWDEPLRSKWGALEGLYGDSRGGFLAGDALKIALLSGPPVFGLYSIEELQDQPEVREAHQVDAEVLVFMDSANVWFYGIKDDNLFVYDAGTRELDELGNAQTAIEQVLIDAEEAARD